MVDNKEPPSKGPEDKQEEKQYTPYVSHRLRAKMESDDDEEKAGPGAAIAVTGLVVVIVGCGIWFLLGQKHEKKPPAGLWPDPAPLFEKERDLSGPALIADFNHPFFGDRPRAGTALSADNGPVDPRQVDFAHGAQQRFERNELHGSLRGVKVL